MNQLLRLILWVACLALPRLAAAADQPVIGHWQTIDDKTGKPSSIVQTYLEGGKLFGKIEKLLRTDTPPDQRCVKCDGANKDKPVLGLVVVTDLSQDGDTWGGGHVLDPENGVSYRCKLKATGEDILEVRGFVGISLFGRTQTWHRVAAPAAPAAMPPAPPAQAAPKTP